MRAMLFLSLIAFLAYDWTAGRLGGARLRTKLVYGWLLLAAGYHMLIVMGILFTPSYYDLFLRIYGGVAARIVDHLETEGGPSP